MRRLDLAWALLALVCAGCVSTMEAPAGKPVRWETLAVTGVRSTNDLVEHPAVVGAELFLTEPDSGGWGPEFGGRYAWGDADTLGSSGSATRDSEFFELDIGVQQTFERETALRPFVGVGGAWMRAHHSQSSDTESRDFNDYGMGVYLHGGVLWNPQQDEAGRGEGFVIGLDLRGMLADDTDYLELALVTGFGR